MRDFLPADVRKREYVIGIIKEVYESYGFEPLETPAVENLETLTGKYGDEGTQLMFKILKRGAKLDESLDESKEVSDPASSSQSPVSSLSDLALRYDLTVPLARVVAHHKKDLPKFFKRYQIQPVWRADRPARGRFREFYQCDVDAIGSKSVAVEAELISAVTTILDRLGFSDYLIKLNHRELLFSILKSSGVPIDKYDDALVAIDKLDKMPVKDIEQEMRSKGIDAGAISRVMMLYRQFATVVNQGIAVNEILLSSVLPGDLTVLEQLMEMIRFSGSSKVLVYPFLARGLSYYTGAIMEIVLLKSDDNPHFTGSLGGGGRYDGLIGMFGKEQIPACGFSLGLERILVVMDERNMFPAEVAATSADVMVTLLSEETAAESLKLANELRTQGLRVLVYPESDKLGKQIKYADQINVPYVCVLGETEIAANKVTLKNMKTGEQRTVDQNTIKENL